MRLKAKKRFGQHFLIDKNIIQKIVSAFNPSQNDLILEIGPGNGILTQELIKFSRNLILVEIDKDLIPELHQKFPDIKIINKDILECDFSKEFFEKKFRLIGNLPYYITSHILFKIFDNFQIISDALIMIQKEVAERIVAHPSSKDYGILSVLAQFYCEPKILFNVSKNVFRPKPEVDSTIIHLLIKEKIDLDKSEEAALRKIVKTAFNQRRKILKNSLHKLFNEDETSKKNKFFSISFDFSKRSEELNLSEFIYLAKNLAQIDKAS